MDSQTTGECAVCGTRTDQRCSGCKGDSPLFFCSREHQKLLWRTHKVLCGRDPDYFFLPPLNEAELADFRLAKEHPYSEGKNFLETHQEELAALFPDWEAVEALVTRTDGLGMRHSLADALVLSAREHLNSYYQSFGEPLTPSAINSPWQMLAGECRFYLARFMDRELSSGLDLFTALNPYFRAFLYSNTLAVAHSTSRSRTGQPVASAELLTFAGRRVILSVEKCAIDEAMKEVLRGELKRRMEDLRRRAVSLV
ncbi:hypothetical protein JCM10213_007584 [Rhodosporidiobolus nylandii]